MQEQCQSGVRSRCEGDAALIRADIQQSLAELAAGRTTLVIAHRLATIQHADRIVVVDESGIAEEGAHEELLAHRGAYWRLHSAQFGELAAAADSLTS